MTIAEDDWSELEAGELGHGVVSRRILPYSGHDIFIAVQRPARNRMLLIRLPAAVVEAFVRQEGNLPQTRGLHMAFTPAPDGNRDLQLVLTADDRREVFNPLI